MRKLDSTFLETTDRYHALLNALDEGFCIIEMIFDKDGIPQDYRFLEINAAFETQTGIHQGQGRRMREIAPEHERHWFEIYGKVALTGEPIRFENEAKQLNRWFDVYAFRVDDPSSRRVAILFNDITARKEVEKALRESLAREQAERERAEAANRLKDDFLAWISHELRTPLSAIIGWSALLRSQRLDDAAAAKAVQVIERNAHLQQQLIEDLMDVSRIVSGKLRIELHPIELTPVVRGAVDSLRPSADAKGIRLSCSFDPAVIQVSGDASRLQQVVSNLTTNAIKFTPQGGSIEVRLHCTESTAEIVVSDTGEGIAPEFLPHVFDRFTQGDRTHIRDNRGLGLGLAIVRHLASLHGGEVHAASPGKGQGATFTVQLPLLRLTGSPGI